MPSEYFIQPHRPAIVLAPMEGVTDAPMRAFLSALGGIDFCVSEFVRVSQDVLPEKSFTNDIPELKTGSVTPSGIKIVTQILGGDPERMLRSAENAVRAGAIAIDVNFGCPAPTVNRNDGGASLLRFPHRIEAILRALRDGLPRSISVSAKLRLGWESIEDIHANAAAAAAGGADWITIHARTRMQSYRPPVFWRKIGQVREQLKIPVIANGDIWTVEDYRRAREETGCAHFMLGRGLLADPYLANRIRAEWEGREFFALPDAYPNTTIPRARLNWREMARQFIHFAEPYSNGSEYTACRMKQWLRYASQRGQIECFETIKRLPTPAEIVAALPSA